MTEAKLRNEITRFAKSLFDRGLSSGGSGNISVRFKDGWLMTPTGVSLGTMDPERISLLDASGSHVGGDRPTKESFLHMAIYDARPKAGAIVHLHSSHAVAVSCLQDLDAENAIPPLTAYFAMRFGKLPIVPYAPPGDPKLAESVRSAAAEHHAILLANHGPVVAGKDLKDAVYASEELEETAKLFLMLRRMKTSLLSDAEVAVLQRRFPVEC